MNAEFGYCKIDFYRQQVIEKKQIDIFEVPRARVTFQFVRRIHRILYDRTKVKPNLT